MAEFLWSLAKIYSLAAPWVLVLVYGLAPSNLAKIFEIFFTKRRTDVLDEIINGLVGGAAKKQKNR